MIAYHKVTSSWVDGFGFDSGSSTLYVGTQGKYYRVDGLDQSEVQKILDAANSGASVGSEVSAIFQANKSATVEVSWDEVEGAVGSSQSPVTSMSSGFMQAVMNFADLLLPQARTGLFSI